jgi:hypothetical protein
MDVRRILPEPTSQSQKVVRRIDLHHHFFLSSLDKVKKNLQVGWRTPPENLPWTPEVSLKFMNAHGIDMAILSVPPSSAGFIGAENRTMARNYNTFAANISKRYPTRFGFFACLPFLDDTEGSVAYLALNSGICQQRRIGLRVILNIRCFGGNCVRIRRAERRWDCFDIILRRG